MDAQAHLMSLGWAGPGHALDSRPQYKQKGHRGLAYNPTLDPLKVGNTGTGLVKPLSISRRKERFGIGKKSHVPPSGTEWWLKGFESALGNIGKPESERSGTTTPTMGADGKHRGLYGFFIKGQVMEGTISEAILQTNGHSKKRKSDMLSEQDDGNNISSKKIKTDGLTLTPIRRKPETALDFATVGAFIRERDKDEKRKARKEQQEDAEQFTQIGQFFAASEKSTKSKKTKTSSGEITKAMEAHSLNEPEAEGREETKEERRERRRKRREEKQKAEQAQTRPIKTKISEDMDDSEDEAARAARKAEKKRRKAEKEAKKLRKS